MLNVVVIGDSHGQLWSGKDALGKGDILPGFKTHFIDGPSAYSLVHNHHSVKTTFSLHFNNTLKSGTFTGWIMTSFGEVDCRTKLHTFSDPFSATDSVVDQYFQFLIDMRLLHRNICVWAPAATAVAGTHGTSTNIKDEIKRNCLAYYFNKQLSIKLLEEKIPMFGILPYMVNDDLTSKKSTTFDLLHARQEMRHGCYQIIENVLENYDSLSKEDVQIQSYNHRLADLMFKDFKESFR